MPRVDNLVNDTRRYSQRDSPRRSYNMYVILSQLFCRHIWAYLNLYLVLRHTRLNIGKKGDSIFFHIHIPFFRYANEFEFELLDFTNNNNTK